MSKFFSKAVMRFKSIAHGENGEKPFAHLTFAADLDSKGARDFGVLDIVENPSIDTEQWVPLNPGVTELGSTCRDLCMRRVLKGSANILKNKTGVMHKLKVKKDGESGDIKVELVLIVGLKDWPAYGELVKMKGIDVIIEAKPGVRAVQRTLKVESGGQSGKKGKAVKDVKYPVMERAAKKAKGAPAKQKKK